MHLRHIEPRSLEWYDAVETNRNQSTDRLDPDQLKKLRVLKAGEMAVALLPAHLSSGHVARSP